MLFISFWGQRVRFRAVQIKHDSTCSLLENQYSPSGCLVDWLVNICFCSSRFLLVRQMLLNPSALFPHQPLDWRVINQIRLLAEHWAPEGRWLQTENVTNVSSDNVQKKSSLDICPVAFYNMKQSTGACLWQRHPHLLEMLRLVKVRQQHH